MTEAGLSGAGSDADTTNQRMELTAVLRAIENLPGELEVHSDSTYVVNCFNDKWYEGWISRGWKNSQKKPVANRDIWEPLITLYLERSDEISFVWVKGHSGNTFNEIADQLAVAEVTKLKEANNPKPAGAGPWADALPAVAPEPLAPDAVQPPWPIEQAIVVSGSRELDTEQIDELTEAIVNLDAENDVIISGLRLGAELLGAEVALKVGIPVGIVLPYADPVRVWSSADRARFDAAVEAAAWVVTLEGDPAKPASAIRGRNAWLWSAAVGAIVAGDDTMVDEAEMAGLGVIAI